MLHVQIWWTASTERRVTYLQDEMFHVQTRWTACRKRNVTYFHDECFTCRLDGRQCAARGVTYLQYKMFHVQTWWTCIAVRRVAYLQYKMFHVQTWWTAFAVRRVAYLQYKMFHVQTWWTACIEWRVTTAWTRMSPSWSTWPRVVSPSSSRSSERDGWVYFTASQTSTNTCPTSTVAWAVSLYTMTGARTPRLYWYVSISWVVIIMGMFFSHDRSDITVMVDWA